MQHNGTTYLPTWQTWVMVRQQRSRFDGNDTPDAPASSTADARNTLRERVQIARIEQRMTVNDLAARSGCDVDTIVAFECGDEILSADLQRRIRTVLRIE